MERHRDPFDVEVGRRLERRRRILGLRQRDVAERVGLKPAHISQLEAGHYESLKFRYLAALARVLQTDVNYLVCFSDEDPGEIPPMRCPGTGRQHACVSLPLVSASRVVAGSDRSV